MLLSQRITQVLEMPFLLYFCKTTPRDHFLKGEKNTDPERKVSVAQPRSLINRSSADKAI